MNNENHFSLELFGLFPCGFFGPKIREKAPPLASSVCPLLSAELLNTVAVLGVSNGATS